MLRNPCDIGPGDSGIRLSEFARDAGRRFPNYREFVQHRAANQVIAGKLLLVHARHELRDGIGSLNDIR
jgi:hypothetical protein